MTALFVGALAFAGPWVRESGSWYAKAAYGQFRSDSYVDGSGELVEGVRFVGHTGVLYGEVGVAERLQVVAALPWQVATNQPQEGLRYHRAGVGDVEVGAGYALSRALPVTAHVVAKVPGYGDAVQGVGDQQGRFPALGDGQVDVTAELSAGRSGSRAGAAWWAEATGGYVRRTQLSLASTPPADFADGVEYVGKVGVAPAWGFAALSASGRGRVTDHAETRTWHQLGATLAVDVAEGLALEASASWIYAARASSRGGAGFLGVSHRR